MKEHTLIRPGYNFSEDELRDIQLIELEMLLEVERICKKCSIHYCISAGTLLGAVRHGGFIPWDDDADVAFLRSEYEKFREACKTELDKTRFYFQDYRNTPGYRWGYGKLRRKNTQFIRLNQEFMPYEQGIFIDIMPYDNVPDKFILRKLHNLCCFLYRKCFWAPVGKRSAQGIEKLAYEVLNLIPDKRLYESFNRFINRCNKKTTKRIRILTLPVPGKEHGYLKDCFLRLTYIDFEGFKLKGMKDYDTYLAYKYGEYMELPPIEARKVHPVSSLKLIENELIKEKNSKL